MVVERSSPQQAAFDESLGDSGQSALEFLIVLPIMLAVVMMLLKVNTAIQISIVDQKYARAQVLFVAGNAADYPLRQEFVFNMNHGGGSNLMVMGVSKNAPATTSDEGETHPSAPEFYIARNGAKPASTDQLNQQEPSTRTNVRIRSTVSFCVPLMTLGGAPLVSFSVGGQGVQKFNLPENPTSYTFCKTSIGGLAPAPST